MNNDIDKEEELGENTPPPAFLTIVQGYLWGINGSPIRNIDDAIKSKHTRVLTTQDILLELADMADMELNNVTACMAYLGYICGRVDGKLGWLIHIDI